MRSQAHWSQTSEESRPSCEQRGKPKHSPGEVQSLDACSVEAFRWKASGLFHWPGCGQGRRSPWMRYGTERPRSAPRKGGVGQTGGRGPSAKAVQGLECLVGVG